MKVKQEAKMMWCPSEEYVQTSSIFKFMEYAGNKIQIKFGKSCIATDQLLQVQEVGVIVVTTSLEVIYW